MEFKVVKRDLTLSDGWRLAYANDVKRNMEKVKNVFKTENQWIVCQLADGRIKGSGNDYEIKLEIDTGLGDKLIVKLSG